MFVAAAGVVGFFVWKASRDLPDYESLAKYEPPVMTRIHAHDGSLMAEYARERRIFVPINVIPKRVIAAFLSAEDKRFYEHGGLDFTGIGRAAYKFVTNYRQSLGAAHRGRLDHHAAGGQELPAVERPHDRAQAEGGDPRHPHRARLLQGQDPRALSQRDLPRHGLLRRGRRRAQLLQQGAEPSSTIEEAAYLAALPKAPNNYHPFRRAQGGDDPAQLDHRPDGRDRLRSPREEARLAKAKPLKVNIRPLGTQIYAADYFAEDVRRTLVNNFGEDGLYGRAERSATGDGRVNGGLSVRTTLDPNLQRMARKALIDGLVAFDREKGWRGPVQKIDIAGDWGAALTGIEIAERPGALAPRRRARGAEDQGGRGPAPGPPGGRQPASRSARRSRSPSTR